MKYFIFTLVIIFKFFTLTATAQTASDSLRAQAQKLDFDAKAKTSHAFDLRKLVSAKKIQAIKEKDKELSTTLKNEATQLEQQAKDNFVEASLLKKQANEIRKQAADLVKQNKATKAATINSNVNNVIIASPKNVIANEIKGDYVEIFELPNYQGKSVKYSINTEHYNVKIPFSSNTISIKFSDENKIIFFLVEEEPQTSNLKTIINSTPQFPINAANISTVVVGTKKIMEVDFNGIIYQNHLDYSSSLHNNDCKKFYGKIQYKIMMRLRAKNGKGSAESLLINPYTNEPVVNAIIYNQPKYDDNVCPFLYTSAEANLTPKMARTQARGFNNRSKVLVTIPQIPKAKQFFYIDSASYQHNKARYFMTAKVKIGSAHKGCDVCTDFTWDAEMNKEDTIHVNLPNDFQQDFPEAPNRFQWYDFIQLGPFRKHDVLDGRNEDNFTGREHPTYIQFTTKTVNRIY